MEPVRDYELAAFLTHVIGVLERLGIPYMVVGGFAAILYGEPRLTIDVDIVADMSVERVGAFVAAFPSPDYYANAESIRDALVRRSLFNVIQSSTGAKVDLVPLPTDPFTRAAFARRQRLQYDARGHTATFITAEDIVLAKLVAFQRTRSDKHLRDARGVLLMQWADLDIEALRRGASGLGMRGPLDDLLSAVRHQLEE